MLSVQNPPANVLLHQIEDAIRSTAEDSPRPEFGGRPWPPIDSYARIEHDGGKLSAAIDHHTYQGSLDVRREGEISMTLSWTRSWNGVHSTNATHLTDTVAAFAWCSRVIAMKAFGGLRAVESMRFAATLAVPPETRWLVPNAWLGLDSRHTLVVRYTGPTQEAPYIVGPLELGWVKPLPATLTAHVQQVVRELLFDLRPDDPKQAHLGRPRVDAHALETRLRDSKFLQCWSHEQT
jgi:hypothetical protein